MVHLGISQDLYDSGVCLTDGERVLYAANEERFTRRKNQGGFPRRALEAAFRQTGLDPAQVRRICVAGEMTPPLPMRLFPGPQDRLAASRQGGAPSHLSRVADLIAFHTPLLHTAEDSLLRPLVRPLLGPALRRLLPPDLRSARIRFVDHHRAHAASAWHLSGWDRALVLTGDGMGDGLSLTVSSTASGTLHRLWRASSRSSLGLFFEALTEALGFTPCRDEGKLTGLAARGDPRRVAVASPFAWRGGELTYSGPTGLRAVEWAREHLIARHSREDISAWAQEILESQVLTIARRWVGRTSLRRLAVAGGIFANVKLNQRLHELDGVAELFVCPNMGDGGLSLGATCAAGGLRRQRLDDVFWGDSFDVGHIERALSSAGLAFETPEDIDGRVGDLVADGAIVARFRSRMEWGPRALGNRSILASASDPGVTSKLNDLLERSDFMPFAPAVLAADLDRFASRADGARHAAEFMTVLFDCTPLMRRENPAVVHVDGTARIQAVSRRANPSFHAVLQQVKRRTGHGVVLNTSFNIHEEPIVRTPEEAVSAFLRARLDYLAVGPFLVKGPAPESSAP